MDKFDDIAAKYPGAGTLVKGIQILETLSAEGGPCTSSLLLSKTNLPKATLYRLLGALVEFGYLRHDTRLKTYSLGHRFVELGREALEVFDLREAASQELARLSTKINETVSLAVLENDMMIHVEVRRAPNPLSVGVELGRAHSAVGSASGQALLAAMPPHKINGFLGGLQAGERAKILADIAISRARGYTISMSKQLPGVVIIAAPIQGPPGMGAGAVVVNALADRWSYEQRHILGRDLMEAARRIMGNIGSAPVSITPNPRRSPNIDPGLKCVAPVGAIVGEGPAWDAETGILHWVDVAEPGFHTFNPDTGEDKMTHSPYLVSAILPAQKNEFIAITQNGVEAYDVNSGQLASIYDPEAHMPSNRFNDAKVDRMGRIWAGSMSLDASMPSGSLYCFDTLTSARAMDGGFQVSNGLDWSPDDQKFYFVDSALGTVFSYDFDLASGAITNKQIFLHFDAKEGKPDGLTVDSQGNLWIALWDGWRVVCYSADGVLLREVDMPVPRPTSCCFGGDDLKTLYITSASIRLPAEVLEEAPLSGGLFAIDVDVAGQPISEVKL